MCMRACRSSLQQSQTLCATGAVTWLSSLCLLVFCHTGLLDGWQLTQTIQGHVVSETLHHELIVQGGQG